MLKGSMSHVRGPKSYIDILLLQETHFKSGSTPPIRSKYYSTWIHSFSPLSKTKVVSIGLHKNLPFTLLDSKVYQEGRFVFFKISLFQKIVTVPNINSPNSNQVNFVLDILRQLESFASGYLLMGGDPNLTLEPNLDTTL